MMACASFHVARHSLLIPSGIGRGYSELTGSTLAARLRRINPVSVAVTGFRELWR